MYTPNAGLEASYAVLWWLMLQGAGLLALPLAFRLFRHLPDRGYALSKPLGLVLVNYILWLLGTLGILRNTWGNILVAAILATGVALSFYRLGQQRSEENRSALWGWVREHSAVVIASELVFTLALALWTLYKAYDPNIAITEKPMEFAFLNAITRGERFPPYDPWMSGYGISYYYFGYVIVSTLAKFGGIPTSFAFNLGIASLFALTASGAFSVAYNCVYVVARRRTRPTGRGSQGPSGVPNSSGRSAVQTAIYYGVLAAIMIPLMGNLEGALEFLYAHGVGVTVNEPGNVTGPFWEWIDVKNLTSSGVISDTWYPTGGWWWWRASRVIHDKGLTGNDMEVIDEFPAFSFLLGDMHPHVLAYPFVFLAIGLAFNLLLAKEAPSEGDWWFVYLSLGAIGFLNTWDMPFYYFLLVAAYGLSRYLRPDLVSSSSLERALGQGVGRLVSLPSWLRQVIFRAIELGVASILLYLPYWLYSRPKAGVGILPNLFNVARFSQLFLMFGTFLVGLGAFLIVSFLELWRRGWVTRKSLIRRGLPIWVGTMLFFPVLLALVLIPVIASPTIRTYIDDVLASPEVQQFLGPQTLASLLKVSLRIRLGFLPPQLREVRMSAGPWTFVILSLFLAAVVFWVVQTTITPRRQIGVGTESDGMSSTEPGLDVALPSLRFCMLMAFVGLMLVFSVEFLYLRDAFGTRMNTVFKFYFQAWVLLGLVAVFGLYYVLEGYGPRERGLRSRIGRGAFGLFFALLFCAGLLYPLGASGSRSEGFAGPPTLDGMAFVARERPEEYEAVQWLNHNVPDHPVIAEAVRGSFAYEYARVSSRTGLPAVMGWTGHEGQWHGFTPEIAQRAEDVNSLYSGSIADAQRIMAKYDVTYVFVGYLERNEFGSALDKFEQFMDVAFRAGDTVIYERRGA